ncbi:MAG: zinc ribbon domain-containing protein [Candidatus Hodarchaeales archaeon]
MTSRAQTRKKQNGTVVHTAGRRSVKYDLKDEFRGRITVRELKECRDTAVELWHGYREKVAHHERIYWRIMQKVKYVDREDALVPVLHWWETTKKPRPPCQAAGYAPRKLPRRANIKTTAFLHTRPTKLTRSWLEVYFPERRKHLWLPLNPSSYHVNQLRATQPKTIQLVKHPNGRWYAHVTIAFVLPSISSAKKPLAVVSFDLGMNKSVVAVLLTEDHPGTLYRQDVKYFEQQEKKNSINELDNQIASLQRKQEEYTKAGKNPKNIIRALKRLAHQRRAVAIHYDHQLTAEITQWVQRLSHRYEVHVALGELKGIRQSRRKGDGQSRKHRRELHRWAFARISDLLTYKLQRGGVPSEHFHPIREAWTSKTCSRCGSTDTSRPFQALLRCHTCGVHLQADENGALNIAFKLIISLDEAALDPWLPHQLLAKKYPDRQGSSNQALTKTPQAGTPEEEAGVSVAGRTPPCTRVESLTSRPRRGDEVPSPVELGMESANHNLWLAFA